MSQGVKIILIVVEILGAVGLACVGVFASFGYFFVDHEGIVKSGDEGQEFGKTTDNLGCQTRALELAKPLRDTEITGVVKIQYFFSGCLETSRRTPAFCDGLPSDYADIINDDKTKDAECARLGFRESSRCRTLMKEKLDFCHK